MSFRVQYVLDAEDDCPLLTHDGPVPLPDEAVFIGSDLYLVAGRLWYLSPATEDVIVRVVVEKIGEWSGFDT